MSTRHFRQFVMLCLFVGVATAVFAIKSVATAQPAPLPAMPDERALLPHLPQNGEGEDGGTMILSPDAPMWSKGVYQSYRDGNWEIYSSHAPGRLTVHNSSDIHPRFNRGATRVVFSSNRDGDYEIYVMDAHGANITQLTHNGTHDVNPIWSPDGTRIAFQAYRDGQAEIYVMNADGSNETRLTAHSNYDGEPTWSPDGSKIAFTSSRSGLPFIYVMNRDGTGLSQLSGQPSFYAAWSPDGAQIAYSGDQDGDGWLELWLMNTNGANQHMLYDPIDQRTDAWARGWSADGRQITFTEIHFVQYQGNWYWDRAIIQELDPDTGLPSGLSGLTSDWHPDWQTMDATPPQSEAKPLSAFSQIPDFRLYWSGNDQEEGAGLAAYDVQYRVGSSGPWVDWQTGITETSAVYTAVPGTTVSFRVRARDHAYNWEPWNSFGNPVTTFYTWALWGQLTDNRGAPLNNAPLAITPAPLNEAITDGEGDFLTRLKTVGSHTLDVQRAGYGDMAATPLNMENVSHLYLLPGNNVLQNGGFEAGGQPLANWTSSGSLPVTAVANRRHTGNNAALLGNASCTYPCLSGLEMTGHMFYEADMAADSFGNVYVAWQDSSALLASRSPAGIWSQSQPFAPINVILPKVAVDQDDEIHVLGTEVDHVYYAHKAPGSSWSDPTIVATIAYQPGDYYPYVREVLADSQGGLHVLVEEAPTYVAYAPPVNSVYLYRQPDGVWQMPILLNGSMYPLNYMGGLIAIGADDTLHYARLEQNLDSYPFKNELIYRQRFADGTWGYDEPPHLIESGYAPLLESMAAAANGVVHVTWSTQTLDTYLNTYHAVRAADGAWSGPTIIRQRDSFHGHDPTSHASIDSRGNLHALLMDSSFDDPAFYYRVWRPESGWQAAAALPIMGLYFRAPQTAVDRYDMVHLLIPEEGGEGNYFHSLPAAGSGSVSLSQVVTVPAGMPAPTLAFMAQRPGDVPDDASGFELWVSNGITTTAVPVAASGAAWSHHWVDMTPWAGQTVTVTFQLVQASGDPRVTLTLDDVSLGSSYPDVWVQGPGKSVALPGDEVVFQLTYGNQGGISTTSGVITATLPEELSFISASVPPTITANVLVWEVGDLNAESGPFPIVITTSVSSSASLLQTLTIPIVIHTATSELEQANNTTMIELYIARRVFLPILFKP